MGPQFLLRLVLAAAVASFAPACVEEEPVGGGEPGDDPAPPDDPGTPAPGGGSNGEWRTLVDGEWELPAGTEGYKCVYKTVEQDLYINEFDAVAPPGTHHTVLTAGPAEQPDGIYDCDAATNMQAQIYGSGVGTNPLAFPEGVAIKIPAGHQLLLNLHLFNATDAPMGGISGTRMKTIAIDEVVHEAEAMLMGKVFTLSVPEGESTQVGTCRMNGEVTIFAMQPHMHQLGTHMKVVAKSSQNGDMTLWDEPYSFDEQIARLVGPVSLNRGDEVQVHCTYLNTTGRTVPFGDSSNQEMCFAGVYRYPKLGGGLFGFICARD